MTSNQESKVSMYHAVMDYLMAKLDSVKDLPNFNPIYVELQDKIKQLLQLTELQQFDKKGIISTKNEIKNGLVALVADSSRRLTVFAKFEKNAVLLAEIKYPESELKHVSNSKLRDIAQGVYDRAQERLAQLGTYGITEATQTALLKGINDFVVAVPKTRLSLNDNLQVTSKIVGIFKEIDEKFKNIDTIIEIVRNSDPNFYNGYKLARKLVKNTGSSLLVRGVITDSVSGEAIKGALVTFTMNGNGGVNKAIKERVSFFKKSAALGGFNIKTMPEGTYYVTIKKAGYADQQTTVTISNGELKDLEIKLVKL
jgi:hypothetical protein